MIIGVMADSHDNLPMIRAALAAFAAADARLLVHAGDFVAPFAVRAVLEFPHRAVGIFGNNDGERAGIRKIWPEVTNGLLTMRVANRNILVIHDRTRLAPDSLASADILIHGHTHRAEITREGHPLCVNPGECGGWLTGKPTVALIDTDTMHAEIVHLTAGNPASGEGHQ